MIWIFFEKNHIIDTIGSIDALIESNNSLIEKLKQLICLKYRTSFPNIHNTETGNNVVTLDNVTSKFATGLNPRKNFVLGHGNNYYVTIKNFDNWIIMLDDKCDMVDDEAIIKINKRSDLKINDILFSSIGTIGRTCLIDEEPSNWNISESIFTIRNNEKISPELLFLLLLDDDLQTFATDNASGSVQLGIRMGDLKSYRFNLPLKSDIESFTNSISPLFSQINTLKKKNKNLIIQKQIYLKKFFG